MRVEHGGHWAELSEAPFSWGQRNRIRDGMDKGLYEGFATTLVTERVIAWSEPGKPSDPKAWEPVDADFGDAVFRAALGMWKAAPDPNVTAVPSSDSPPAAPSETQSQSS